MLQKPMKLIVFVTFLSAAFASEDMVKFDGSVRYRVERTDKEGSDLRNRHRFQAKLRAKAKVNEYTNGEIALISGGEEPTSSNDTLDTGFSTKELRIDKANISFKYNKLSAYLGKASNKVKKPLKSQLIWDGDVTVEGIQALYSYSLWADSAIKHNFSYLILDENSSDVERNLYTAQLYLEQKISDSKLVVGGSLYNFDGFKGRSLLDPGASTASNNGNTSSSSAYTNHYHLIEYFVEAHFSLIGLPIVLAYDYVKNDAAKNDNIGWWAGLKVNKAKKPGQFEFHWNYRRVETDAVLGFLTDSDFKGGGTDGVGHQFSLKYALLDNTSLKLTHFINETSLDKAITKDYSKTQLDLKVSF